jgi:phosphoribosylformylglycinamidine (FGAM) synthase PurS component
MQYYTLRGEHNKTMSLKKFLIVVNIENKVYLPDPEGGTILSDLVIKGGYSNVESVRSAKTLKIIVRSSSEKKALKTVQNLCSELRIFNPVLSDCTIESRGALRGTGS